MKVERKEAEFQPVVITLESQFEVEVMKELVGSVTGAGDVRDFLNNIYHALEKHSPGHTYFFEGYVRIA